MAAFFSLVVPFYNEKNCQNYQRLTDYLIDRFPQYELIFVNDGSDQTLVLNLEKAIKQDLRAKLISYSRNQGRDYAIIQGFKKAKGQYLAYIDGDFEISHTYL